MTSRNFILIIGLLVILGIAAFILYPRTAMQGNKQMNDTSDTVTQDENQSDNNSSPQAGAGRYVVYQDGVLEQHADNKRVLFFYANWCPTCIPVDKVFMNQESQIPEGISVIRINYNDTETDKEEKDLAKKYGITYQHTFVQIDSDGNEVTKWNGGAMSELLENIK